MSDRWVFCGICNDVTISTVSGSGRHKTCWDCEDRRIRKNKAEVIQISHKKEGWIAMEMSREEFNSGFPNGVTDPNFEARTITEFGRL